MAAPGVVVPECANEWELLFETSKMTNKLLVVDFKANWSGPCKVMKHIFQQFAFKYTDAVFVEIDVDKFPDVAERFGAMRELPTFLLIKQGNVVDKVTGPKPNELERAIQEHN